MAANSNQIDQLAAFKAFNYHHQDTWANNVIHFWDGADTFSATALRAWFNFFFRKHLPNLYENDSVTGSLGVIGAAATIAFILLGGYFYHKHRTLRTLRAELTEEFLLEFYAHTERDEYGSLRGILFPQSNSSPGNITLSRNEDQNSSEFKSMLRTKQIIEAYLLEADEDEQRRVNNIKEFIDRDEKNKENVLEQLNANNENLGTSNEQLSDTAFQKSWKQGYEFITQVGYIHWIVWIIGTILLYQTVDGYGTPAKNPDKGDDQHDSPSYFDVDGYFGDVLITLELLGAFLAAAVILHYQNQERKKLKEQVKEEDLATSKRQREHLRGWYLLELESQPSDKTIAAKVSPEKTDLKAKKKEAYNFDANITKTYVFSFGSYFLGNFLLTNIFIWPVLVGISIALEETGLAPDLEEHPNHLDPNAVMVPIVFGLTLVAAAYHSWLSLREQDAKTQKHKTFTVGEKRDAAQYVEATSISNFFSYWGKKENRWDLAYIVYGRLVGSGGILLSRVLFNGGIGNFRMEDGEPTLEPFSRMEIIPFAVAFAVVSIVWNLVDHYYRSKQEDCHKQARDNSLLQAATVKRNQTHPG